MRTNTAPASLLVSYAANTASFLAHSGLSLYGAQKQYLNVQHSCATQSRTEMSSSAESVCNKRKGF